MSAEALLHRYLAGERGDISDTMRSLPATVDVAVVVAVVEKLIDNKYWIGRSCKKLPPRVIRGVLAASMSHPNHLFLRLAVPPVANDALLQTSWTHALETLLDLDASYSWGSVQMRAKIAKLVADKPMLGAIQGTVAHADKTGMTMLAVLAADGSDVSYDALVRHIDIAFTSRDRRLDLLRDLRKHAARTPALDRLFSDLDDALQERNDTSPARLLGPIIGIGEVELLWFDVRLSSTTKAPHGNVPWIQGSVHVDSRSPTWFSVWASTVDPHALEISQITSFNNAGTQHDTLELGACKPEELPVWIANAAAKLKTAWEPFEPRSNLRGKKRAQVAQWLGGTPTLTKPHKRG